MLVLKNQRKKFNYALLYIEGKPDLKDKYGCLRVAFEEIDEEKLHIFDCSFTK